MYSARKTRSVTASTDRLAHCAAVGLNRDGSGLAARDVSVDLACWTSIRLAPKMPAAVNAITTSESASRRPFEVAPTFISRICASTYALAPPLAASMLLCCGPHPSAFVLLAIAVHGKSARGTAQQASVAALIRESHSQTKATNLTPA